MNSDPYACIQTTFFGLPYTETDKIHPDQIYLYSASGYAEEVYTLEEFKGGNDFTINQVGMYIEASPGFADKYISRYSIPIVPVFPAKKTQGSPEYLKLLEEMADLHSRKNAGYSGQSSDPWSNFRECQKFGIDAFTGVLVRMSDKWSRIRSLVENPANEQVGESIKDTLKDLASYALIATILYDERTND